MRTPTLLLLLALAACGSAPPSESTTASETPAEPETEPAELDEAPAEEPPSEGPLLRAWHEDQSRRSGSLRVFVPVEQDLGPSRFRQMWRFDADGQGRVNVLSPNDAHFEVPATWERSGDELTLRWSGGSQVAFERFRIVRLDDELHVEPCRAHDATRVRVL